MDKAIETTISAAQPGKSVPLLSTTKPSQASPAQILSLGKTFSTSHPVLSQCSETLSISTTTLARKY